MFKPRIKLSLYRRCWPYYGNFIHIFVRGGRDIPFNALPEAVQDRKNALDGPYDGGEKNY
jgi:hypothetical protein